jgi:hypothetical protein
MSEPMLISVLKSTVFFFNEEKSVRESMMDGGKEVKTNKTKLNSVALVRKRTIPTERPPLSAK